MNKYLFFTITLIFFTGCSFKNQVAQQEKELKIYSPEQIASLIVLDSKKEMPLKMKKDINGDEIELSLTNVYREKNKVFFDIKMAGENLSKNEKELHDFIALGVQLGTFEKSSSKSYCNTSTIRAMLNLGAVIIINIDINNKIIPVKIDKNNCDKYYPLDEEN